jgi:hypothetical protein
LRKGQNRAAGDGGAQSVRHLASAKVRILGPTPRRAPNAPADARHCAPHSWLKEEMGSEFSEDELLASVLKMRRESAAKSGAEQPTTEQLWQKLRQLEGYKAVTQQQVKRAEDKANRLTQRTAQSHAERAAAQRAADEERESKFAPDDAYEAPPTTFAYQCKVYGDGITQAKAREPAFFWIEAFDCQGLKRKDGGDTFAVAVRGPSKTHASVTDNNDGTYLCLWKPWCSGIYQIAISLGGTHTLLSTPE